MRDCHLIIAGELLGRLADEVEAWLAVLRLDRTCHVQDGLPRGSVIRCSAVVPAP